MPQRNFRETHIWFCNDCDFKTEGAERTIGMVTRLHKKKCKKTGRTEKKKVTLEQDKKIGRMGKITYSAWSTKE